MAQRTGLQRGLAWSIGFSVAGLVGVLLVAQRLNYSLVARTIDPGYLGFSVVLILGVWCVRAWRFQALARALGKRQSFGHVFRHYLVSAFVAHVTPGSSGGAPTLIYLLHRDGMSLGRATAMIAVDGTFTVGFLLLATPAIVLWRRPTLSLPAGRDGLLLAMAVLMVVTGVLLFAAIWKPKLLGRLGAWALDTRWVSRFTGPARREAWARRIRRETLGFSVGVRWVLSRDVWAFLVLIVSTVAYWALYLSIAPVLLRGLGVQVDWFQTVLAQVVFNLLQPLVPTPGSSGGAEIGLAYLFRSYVPPGELTVFVVAWRFVTFYSSLIVGGFCSLGLLWRPRARLQS